ncbi:zinc finger protein 346 isoform X2 [Nematolebias whitei]|uniref:zinc finger protein 346 isoform X2 n=1 Tax=Nematolebias whitei TaxID=451745 RepID=UPI00189BB85A|nr:zinc finger protein 346 isoform X2 [Nematolebias whitei]
MAEPMQTDDFPYSPSGLAEVNKMIKEHGNLFSDTQCKVCNAVLNSESQKLTHYQSKKHGNRVRRHFSLKNEKEETVKKVKTSDNEDCGNGVTDRMKACPLCNMTFTSPVMAESHYQGKLHARKLKMKTAEKQTPVEAPQTAKAKEKPVAVSSGVTDTDNNDPDRYCSTCKASFNNPLMAQQHYEGKKHKKRMSQLKLFETYGPSTAPVSTQNGYSCTICNIVLNSVEQYQSHITGAKHKNQMKKSGLNPEEDQLPAEQSQDDNNQCASADDQLAAGEDEFAAGEDEFAAGEDEFAPGDGQYDAEDGRCK